MKETIIVRGAGDLATGIIAKLHNANFNVIALETSQPTSIRRYVSFSEAIYNNQFEVEGIKATLCTSSNLEKTLSQGIALLIDPKAELIDQIKPLAVVDAIIAKRNIVTRINMAPIVIGVGPGFESTVDCHAVIETKRGHDLGRIYYQGCAYPDTKIPGNVAGYTIERVIKAPISGELKVIKDITAIVDKGETILTIDGVEVKAQIPGLIRGMIRDKTFVKKGMKIADIDPRVEEKDNCYKISDKARCIAGGVLEAILKLRSEINE